jgi:periplasmic divalent cation tolerance protein
MSELYDDPNDSPVPLSEQGSLGTLVVVTNLPDHNAAVRMAGQLVDERLVACANVLAPCTSVYRWQDKVNQEQEVPVWLKTTRRNLSQVMQRVHEIHPHDVPEILALEPRDVLPAYSDWVVQSTSR